MQFAETPIPGVWIVDGPAFADERGSLFPAWVQSDFAARGLETGIAQVTMATNHQRSTLRGLHYQASPMEEVKVIRAVRGAVYDVVVDLRPDSPTFCRWTGVELSADNRRMLYVPRGFAHGYQTLTDDTEIVYLVSTPYSPGHQRGVRWDDPAFGIAWPLGAPAVIHPRDAAYPDFRR
ncbi:MAG: dTDP-4-dehydrorhamnose 3,5-epimerase [Vicinamibacterales bacterium]